MLDDPYFYRPSPKGAHEPVLTSEVKQLNHRLKSFQYVKNWNFALDIGANVGHWTRDLSKRFHKVLAIEPQQLFVDCFKKNIFGDNVELLQVGLSDKTEHTYMAPNKQQMEYRDDSNIKCITLDSLGIKDPIDYVKIDIDGWEYQCLVGAEQTLRKQKDIVINIEIKQKNLKDKFLKVFDLLKNYGYKKVDRKAGDYQFVK